MYTLYILSCNHTIPYTYICIYIYCIYVLYIYREREKDHHCLICSPFLPYYKRSEFPNRDRKVTICLFHAVWAAAITALSPEWPASHASPRPQHRTIRCSSDKCRRLVDDSPISNPPSISFYGRLEHV